MPLKSNDAQQKEKAMDNIEAWEGAHTRSTMTNLCPTP